MSKYEWIDCGNGRQVYRRINTDAAPQRSAFPCPYTRSDGMDAVLNPIDGKPYESRSAYERTVREAGCEIVGDDAGHWNRSTPEYKPEGLKDDIKQAWQELS